MKTQDFKNRLKLGLIVIAILSLIQLFSCSEEDLTGDTSGQWNVVEPPETASRYNPNKSTLLAFDLLFTIGPDKQIRNYDLVMYDKGVQSTMTGNGNNYTVEADGFILHINDCRRVFNEIVADIDYTLPNGASYSWKGISIAKIQ
jgi:hypothetical protein